MSQTPMIKKNPWIAGLLSGIFPGVGQLYNEEYGKGLLFMLLFCGTFVIWIFGAAIGATGVGEAWFYNGRHMMIFPFAPRMMIILWFLFVGPAIYLMSLFDAVNTSNRRNARFATASAAAGAGFAPPQPPHSPPPQPSSAASSGFTASADTPNQTQQEPEMIHARSETTGAPTANNKKPSLITGRMVVGFILLFIGAVIVLEKINISLINILVDGMVSLVNLWPLIPFGVGMRLLFDYQKLRDKGQLVLGVILTASGAAFMFELWFDVRVFNAIGDLWPYALLFGGGLLIFSELINRKKS